MVKYITFYRNRWDVSKNNEARTYNSMLQNFNHPKNKKGCINKPLLQFETTNIVIDELHLMLRITDVLLRNLIWAMIQKDLRERNNTKNHMEQLVLAIRSCGITFKVKYRRLNYD